MITIEVSTIINAPVERVWEFMSDFGTMPQWHPGVVKVDWQPPLSVGSVATVTVQRLGKRTARYEVKEWQPNRMIRAQVTSGRSKINGGYEMEPIEGGKTKLTISAVIEIKGVLRLLSPILSYMSKKGSSAEMQNIKRILEAPSLLTHV